MPVFRDQMAFHNFIEGIILHPCDKIDPVQGPLGKKTVVKGIFFYYKYGEDFHFWYLYDLLAGEKITNKTRILDFISCSPEEKRVIPDFFERVYEVNKEVIREIEETYKEAEQRERVDSAFSELSQDRSKKFVSNLIREIDLQIDEHILDFPEEKVLEDKWEEVKGRLLTISLTKKRLQGLRAVWRDYKNNHKNWKGLLKELSEFLEGKLTFEKKDIPPYKPELLRLVAIDFIS